MAVAQQIAAALEAAHERAVVHRDLKPGNIILLADGKVKVLDFGLAKAFEDNVGKEISNLPTLISSAATKADVIFGTAAYMSPEQVKGKTVDRRTDIWAFGVVLYEMLTGKQPFSGDLPRCRYCVDTTRHTLERVTRITPAISRTKHCLVLSKPGKRPTHAKGRREVVPVISLSPGTESRYWLEGILNASLPRALGSRSAYPIPMWVSFLLKGGLIFLERHLLEFKYKCAGYIVASDLSGNAKTGERVV